MCTATLGIPQPADIPPVRTLQVAQGARPSLHPRLAGALEDHSLARREASVFPGQATSPCPVLLSLPVTGHHLPSLLGPSFCSLIFSGFGSPGRGQGGGRWRLPEHSHMAPSIPRVLTGEDHASLCGESGCSAADLLEKARLAHTRSRRLGTVQRPSTHKSSAFRPPLPGRPLEREGPCLQLAFWVLLLLSILLFGCFLVLPAAEEDKSELPAPPLGVNW